MEYYPYKNEEDGHQLIAYSLGNFVSNQRIRNTDGGTMLRFTITKVNDEVDISSLGYYLTWIYKSSIDGKVDYEILPCSKYEYNRFSPSKTSTTSTV